MSNINVQYTFYLNQLYAEYDPHSCAEIEFLEFQELVQIRSSSQKAIQEINQVLLQLPETYSLKKTWILSYQKVQFIQIKDRDILEAFKIFIRKSYLQKQETHQNQQKTTLLSQVNLSAAFLQKAYSEFKSDIDRVRMEPSYALFIYMSNRRAAEEFEYIVRSQMAQKFLEMDNSFIWIDVDGDTRASMICIALPALQGFQEICNGLVR